MANTCSVPKRLFHIRGVHPADCGPHMAQDGCEYSLTQNCKFTYNIMRVFLWFCVAMYLMCGPRQLFSFQCGPETPQDQTPLLGGQGIQTVGSELDCLKWAWSSYGIRMMGNLALKCCSDSSTLLLFHCRPSSSLICHSLSSCLQRSLYTPQESEVVFFF